MTPEQEEYCRLQSEWLENIGGLHKGDELLVMAKAENYQGGWDNTWYFAEWIGRTCQFDGIIDTNAKGIRCHFYGSRYYLPFYVLSKIEKQ